MSDFGALRYSVSMFKRIRIRAHNPSPMDQAGNNTYLLIEGGGGGALVDAGVGKPLHVGAIRRHLLAASAHLERVLVTHAHDDHASGVSVLAVAHEGVRFEKYPWPGHDARFGIRWHPLADGERLAVTGETVRVLHTPGHSPDHIAFWHEPSGTMFTGDLVVPGGRVAIQWSVGGRLDHCLASLERVRAMRPRRLLPAHSAEVTDPGALLQEYLEHRRMREDQVIDALAEGRDTVPSIARSIYDW